jgi:hypothetical protein
MPLWTLTPTHEAHPSWQRSLVRQVLLIRARDEHAARQVASVHFVPAVPLIESSGENPWYHLAIRAPYQGTDYPEAGPEEVLVPRDFER